MKIKINLFKKSKFPIFLFIAASFIALGLLPIFFLSLKSMLWINKERSALKNNYPDTEGKKEYDTSDPFITKVPQLKDIIKKPLISDKDPFFGNKNAPITIVEFSDFECEFCRRQEKILKQIIEDFRDKIGLIWKDYPENNLTSFSFQAAVAARCAGEQNNFWPYHDLLFKKNGGSSEKIFIDLAGKLKLKSGEFKKCLHDDNVRSSVQNNIKEADALNITGVPFIYVNDKEIMGEAYYEELKKIIEDELKNTN